MGRWPKVPPLEAEASWTPPSKFSPPPLPFFRFIPSPPPELWARCLQRGSIKWRGEFERAPEQLDRGASFGGGAGASSMCKKGRGKLQ